MKFFAQLPGYKVTQQRLQQIQGLRNARLIDKVNASLAKASQPSDDKSAGAWGALSAAQLHDLIL